MDRRAQQCALDDGASLERAGQVVALEAGDAGPEPDVAGRRVLILQEAHPLQRPGKRDRGTFQQHLPCQQGAVQLAFGQDPRGRHPASLGGARLKLPHLPSRMSGPRGRGSVVEHHLAKVGVAGSNPVVRSRASAQFRPRSGPALSIRDLATRNDLVNHDRDLSCRRGTRSVRQWRHARASSDLPLPGFPDGPCPVRRQPSSSIHGTEPGQAAYRARGRCRGSGHRGDDRRVPIPARERCWSGCRLDTGRFNGTGGSGRGHICRERPCLRRRNPRRTHRAVREESPNGRTRQVLRLLRLVRGPCARVHV